MLRKSLGTKLDRLFQLMPYHQILWTPIRATGSLPLDTTSLMIFVKQHWQSLWWSCNLWWLSVETSLEKQAKSQNTLLRLRSPTIQWLCTHQPCCGYYWVQSSTPQLLNQSIEIVLDCYLIWLGPLQRSILNSSSHNEEFVKLSVHTSRA